MEVKRRSKDGGMVDAMAAIGALPRRRLTVGPVIKVMESIDR